MAGGLSAQGRLALPLATAALTLRCTARTGTTVAEAAGAGLHPRTDGGLEVRVGSAAPLSVTASGEVGIRTPAPDARLTVDGAARVGGVAVGGFPSGLAYDHAEQTVGAAAQDADLRLQAPDSIDFHRRSRRPGR